MTTQKKNELRNPLTRSSPPVLPMGFRVGISNDIMMVDFLDIPNQDNPNIIYTIALTKGSAQNLADSLAEFLAIPEAK